MNQVALQTFSSFDTGGKPSEELEPERFYHGFVLGLIVDLAGKYRITSNRESGFGRYDEFLDKEKKGSYAQSTSNDFSYDINVILSYFKSLKKHFINLGFVYNLQEKQYDTELLARGITKERIRHYGFAFRGKKVLMGN